jgi:hypothetical protein
MRRAWLVVLALAGTARASSLEIAGDPPPPPPPPAPMIVAPAPPPEEPDQLTNRLTFLAGTGMLWLTIEGVHGSGWALQPTVTRTFDRFELQGEVAISSWRRDDTGPMRALVGRLGATARYQAARLHIENTLALDAVVEAGAGVEQIARDSGAALSRPDLTLGVGLRMAHRDRDASIILGLEVMGRAIVAPGERGLLIVFGLPVGR